MPRCILCRSPIDTSKPIWSLIQGKYYHDFCLCLEKAIEDNWKYRTIREIVTPCNVMSGAMVKLK